MGGGIGERHSYMITVLQELKSFTPSPIQTKHAMERAYRFNSYSKLFLEPIYKVFLVDRHHPNGAEVHMILKSGLVIIYNAESKQLITVEAMRPQQFMNYFKSTNLSPVYYEVLKNTIINTQNKLNLL